LEIANDLKLFENIV